jgi:DNA-binding response OmpR family regulator
MAKILIIDDEPQIRGVLRKALERAGHEVREAGDGLKGITSFRQEPADLVITDILMPDKEGLESIQELKALRPGLRIIAVSGGIPSAPMDVLAVARTFGASRTFWKPFDLATLLAAVEDELRGRNAA